MARYPEPGQRVRWTNAPANMIVRGDMTGVLEKRDGEYLFIKLDGTGSVVELYPSEIEIIYEGPTK